MEEKIDQYLEDILQINEHINLTNITDPDAARMLHIEDSLAVLEEMNKAPEGLYGDMGSGGGFPGVPLALATGRETVLIDSVQKKMRAVQSILDERGLSPRISTYGKRIEELAVESPEQFAVLTARALSKLPSLIELASPLLRQGGQLICMKAQIDDEEIEAAQALEERTGMKMISRRRYHLSDDETYREALVFEKASASSISLPRRIGLAQKKPLK